MAKLNSRFWLKIHRDSATYTDDDEQTYGYNAALGGSQMILQITCFIIMLPQSSLMMIAAVFPFLVADFKLYF